MCPQVTIFFGWIWMALLRVQEPSSVDWFTALQPIRYLKRTPCRLWPSNSELSGLTWVWFCSVASVMSIKEYVICLGRVVKLLHLCKHAPVHWTPEFNRESSTHKKNCRQFRSSGLINSKFQIITKPQTNQRKATVELTSVLVLGRIYYSTRCPRVRFTLFKLNKLCKRGPIFPKLDFSENRKF